MGGCGRVRPHPSRAIVSGLTGRVEAAGKSLCLAFTRSVGNTPLRMTELREARLVVQAERNQKPR